MSGQIPTEIKDTARHNTRFSINRANDTQGLMPLISTNSSISIPHSGSFFLQRQMAAPPQVLEYF